MRRLFLAFALLFAPTLAFGQCNGVFAAGQVCGSGPGGPPGPAAYTTSFPLTIGGLTIDSAAAVRSLNVGSTFTAAQPAEFNINDNQAPADSRLCYFGVLVPGGASNAGFINASCGTSSNPVNWPAGSTSFFGSTYDTGVAGRSYNGEWHNYTASAGTGGTLQSELIYCTLGGTWTPSGAAGCVGEALYANTTVGGFTWGSVPAAAASGTVAANIVSIEADTQYAAGAGGNKVGIQIVDQLNNATGTSTVAAVNTAFQVICVTSSYCWDTGILFPAATGSTIFGVRAAGTLIKSGAGTFGHGVDFSASTCSTDCFKSVGYTVDGSGNATVTSARTPGVLVSALPSCAAGIQGTRMFVTDQATAIAYHGAVTGSGAFKQSVVCDGTSWYQD